MTVPRGPRCAKCGHQVERFELEHDDAAERVMFTAYCHGEVERVTLDREELVVGQDLAYGDAFAGHSEPHALHANKAMQLLGRR